MLHVAVHPSLAPRRSASIFGARSFPLTGVPPPAAEHSEKNGHAERGTPAHNPRQHCCSQVTGAQSSATLLLSSDGRARLSFVAVSSRRGEEEEGLYLQLETRESDLGAISWRHFGSACRRCPYKRQVNSVMLYKRTPAGPLHC
jgi:hypothetical protein